MPIYAIGTLEPDIHPSAYVHPQAVLIGAVVLGPESSVWPHAVIRADENRIVIGARSSVQDCAVLHCTVDLPTIVGDDVTLGHLCHLEGCTIEEQVVVGVGSVVLHEAFVGRGSIVGANAVIRNGQVVPPLSMALGVPAAVREGVMLEGAKLENAEIYVERARLFRTALRRLD